MSAMPNLKKRYFGMTGPQVATLVGLGLLVCLTLGGLTIILLQIEPSTLPSIAEVLPSQTSASEPTEDPYPGVVTTVDDFKISPFCREHRCDFYPQLSKAEETGPGEYFFQIDDLRDTSVTLETQDNVIVRFTIGLGDRAEGQSEDIEVAFSFLSLIDPNFPTNDELNEFVRNNINQRVFQICQASVTDFGQYKMWAGRPHVQVIIVASKCER